MLTREMAVNRKKLKLPWFDLLMIIKNQIADIMEDIAHARADDDKIDQSEVRNIVAENLLEIVPQVANAIWQANGGGAKK